jgi:hypothetical protein
MKTTTQLKRASAIAAAMLAVLLAALETHGADGAASPVARWSFEEIRERKAADAAGCHTWQKGWKTIASQTEPKAGHWHHVAVTAEKGRGRLYVNGKQEAEGALGSSVPATDAPLTIGGVQDGARVMQTFVGALDEVTLFRGALTPTAIRAMADKQTTPHKIEVVEPVKIWSGGAVPKSAEIPVLKGTVFSVIKPYKFDKDGYRFLHGVALAWHKGKLYASFGHNKGGENTDSEEARFCISDDDGKTWGAVATMDAGAEPGIGVSHGVFHSHKGRLWAFHGAYSGTMQNVHTRAYLLDETTGRWQHKGTVIEGGFWPLQQPVRMDDGNWIMAGISARADAAAGGKHPAAVAISRGDDFTKWDLVAIPAGEGVGKMWGESGVIVAGKHITNIARYGDHAQALVATSDDFGRTWTPSLPSNLPMATSKPCTGMLGTGQRYLICSTSADGGKRRAPLTIAVSKPGEAKFSKVFVIRHAEFPSGPGESHPKASLAYPCATEHDGKLYVGYSNSGGGVGRKGTGRELWNNNSAEMAVIPISALKVD